MNPVTCWWCNEFGHIQSQCLKYIHRNTTCHFCKEKGHSVAMCRSKRPGGGIEIKQCIFCRINGHVKENCDILHEWVARAVVDGISEAVANKAFDRRSRICCACFDSYDHKAKHCPTWGESFLDYFQNGGWRRDLPGPCQRVKDEVPWVDNWGLLSPYYSQQYVEKIEKQEEELKAEVAKEIASLRAMGIGGEGSGRRA